MANEFGFDDPDTVTGRASGMLDLPTLRSALRQRRRLWAGLAVLGLLIGAALTVVVPRKYSAVSRIYLVQQPGTDLGAAMAIDASLIQTDSVAGQALKTLHLNIPVQTFESSYKPTVVSDAILSVKLTASSTGVAQERLRALTAAFMADRAELVRQRSNASVVALNNQIQNLSNDEAKLGPAISAATTQSSPSAVITDLIDRQNADNTQLTQLQAQLQQQNLATLSVNGGSRVLDPASPVPQKIKSVVAKDALAGLAAGLGLGFLIIAIGAAVTPRLYRREEVALALGAGVGLSVGSFRVPRIASVWRLRSRLRRPDRDLRAMSDHLTTELNSRREVAAVALDPFEPAALAVAATARAMAAAGRPVTVIDMSDGHWVGALLRDSSSERIKVRFANDDEQPVELELLREEEARLVFAKLDPAVGADRLSDFARSAVIFVSAGRSSVDAAVAARQMLHQAGVVVRSAILVSADPHDESLGTVVRPPDIELPAASGGGKW